MPRAPKRFVIPFPEGEPSEENYGDLLRMVAEALHRRLGLEAVQIVGVYYKPGDDEDMRVDGGFGSVNARQAICQEWLNDFDYPTDDAPAGLPNTTTDEEAE